MKKGKRAAVPTKIKKTPVPKEKKTKPFKYVVSYDEIKGEWIVDTNHCYYHQIQGQLHFTNREVGVLFIWTLNTCELIEIKRDPLWAANIDILLNFYFEKFIPHILANSEVDIYNSKQTADKIALLDEDDSDFESFEE